MKSFKKNLFLGLALGSVLFAGCNKDDDNSEPGPGTGGNTTYKVKFVGTVSPGSSITTASIVYGVNTTGFTSLSGTSWTKEMDLTETDLRAFSENPTKNISFGIQASGSDENATAKSEIFVNGTSVKSAEGHGTILSPNATYIFN